MTSGQGDTDDLNRVIVEGELEVLGRLVDASNATLLAIARDGDAEVQCIYKPRAGERPLWDFPNGDLAEREVATYALSEGLGWGLVPYTAVRDDGPYGAGMVQRWIEVDDELDLVGVVPPKSVPDGWIEVLEARDGEGNPVVLVHAVSRELQQLTLLDAVANNGDRKGGHVIADENGRVFGIDHGVSWHVEDKLRTVLWGWTDTPIPDDLVADLVRLEANWSEFAGTLARLLSEEEVEAAHARLLALRAGGTFPLPSPDWPAIPWPVF